MPAQRIGTLRHVQQVKGSRVSLGGAAAAPTSCAGSSSALASQVLTEVEEMMSSRTTKRSQELQTRL